MAKKRNQDPSEIMNAILAGDLEKVKSLWETGSRVPFCAVKPADGNCKIFG